LLYLNGWARQLGAGLIGMDDAHVRRVVREEIRALLLPMERRLGVLEVLSDQHTVALSQPRLGGGDDQETNDEGTSARGGTTRAHLPGGAEWRRWESEQWSRLEEQLGEQADRQRGLEWALQKHDAALAALRATDASAAATTASASASAALRPPLRASSSSSPAVAPHRAAAMISGGGGLGLSPAFHSPRLTRRPAAVTSRSSSSSTWARHEAARAQAAVSADVQGRSHHGRFLSPKSAWAPADWPGALAAEGVRGVGGRERRSHAHETAGWWWLVHLLAPPHHGCAGRFHLGCGAFGLRFTHIAPVLIKES
jgi:hypothetical protein